MQNKVGIKLYKKSELPRFKCFHNGIILIVICFRNVKIKYFTNIEYTFQ
jgi:hypothetical protein